MSETILDNVSRIVGVAVGDDSFKDELLMHIASSLALSNQLGAGKPIEVTEKTTWEDFKDKSQAKGNYSFGLVKQLVYTQVKMLFDPPTATSLNVMKSISEELKWRIKEAYAIDNQIPSSEGGELLWQEKI